jgi:phosphate acyltransferase
VHEQVASAFRQHPPAPEVGQAVRTAFERLDYSEYGGAPLLGVAAPVLIGHGRSGPPAVMNMIKAARAAVAHDVNSRIVARIAAAARESPA